MKTIYWVIIGGVIIIGLYFSGVLTKLIPSLNYPLQGRILPPSDRQQYNKMMGLQQVAYQPPIGHKVPIKRCIYGICENTTNLTNETYV